jgi:hypothetical protein
MNAQEKFIADDATLSDFWVRLSGDGCAMDHISEMLERIVAERARAHAEAARIFYNGNREEPVSPVHVADILRELAEKANLLELALEGASRRGDVSDAAPGLIEAAGEIVRGLRRAEAIVAAEHKMLEAENK